MTVLGWQQPLRLWRPTFANYLRDFSAEDSENGRSLRAARPGPKERTGVRLKSVAWH